ncbi:MAG: 4-hydroxy-tetrahydrodipicolinate reductase [Bacteroidetes bacterium]|nr:MAG: 4-hydroxy-tetrahydrodipicolinate reductase [Bacteroidota bacterium]
MNIALLGYGKMGKAIEQEALQRGHHISFKIDLHNYEQLQQLKPENTDVVIEFTHPDSFWNNLQALLPKGIPLVSGTTGWHQRLPEVRQLVETQRAAFMYSSNFSIGVNILFILNRRLARLMNRYPEYDCFIEEQHHRHKADAPSGTALSLAQDLIDRLDRKTTLATHALLHRAPLPEELSVGYVRSGEIAGRHRVCYTSEIDTLTIEHHAHQRRGFALGAVIAAEWLKDKGEGFYDFGQLFEE